MPIYDKPTRLLLHEFSAEKLQKDQIFKSDEAVQWFSARYPKIKPITVKLHLEGMSVNNINSRKHLKNVRPDSGHDLFFKVGSGQFRLWNRETDPAPVYRDDVILSTKEQISEDHEKEEVEIEGSREFAFERDLRSYLAKNINLIESGLRVYEEEDISGIEFAVGGRFIDILAVDCDGGYVVIELKVSRGYDRTVGQLLRYMGWIDANLATGRRCRGIIIASEITEDLKLATSRIADVKLIEYELSLRLKPVER